MQYRSDANAHLRGYAPTLLGLCALLLAATPACSDDTAAADTATTGPDISVEVLGDNGPLDAAAGTDAPAGPDGPPALDVPPADPGSADAGPVDSGPPDAGPPDSSPTDSGPADSGPVDGGPVDSGPVDSGPADTGPPDVGTPDVGTPDVGTPDVGTPDVGAPDVGTPDVGPADTGPADTGPVEPSCTTDSDCLNEAGTPLCDAATQLCVALPRGHQIGWRDGAPGSVDILTLVQWNQDFEATDLEFHPTRNELWVVNRTFEVSGQCTQNNVQSARCASLGGWVAVLFSPGTAGQQVEIHEDGNAWHFMRRPPAMAMGANGTWATCGEALTGNFEDDPANFIGPTLWSSDLTVFGPGPPALNGSHLDMLHATPNCMGIAHEEANVYWALNGLVGSLDRYDFGADHGPGNDDHSDGTIHRYVQGQLSREPGVPSHMAFNADDDHLYIADTGNGRVVKLDTTSGSAGGPFAPVYEALADYGVMAGAALTEVVAPGTLTSPSGLLLHDDLLFVTDSATSRFYAFELDGTLVNTLDTGFPAGTLSGLAIGPAGQIFFASMKTGEVYRLDPK